MRLFDIDGDVVDPPEFSPTRLPMGLETSSTFSSLLAPSLITLCYFFVVVVYVLGIGIVGLMLWHRQRAMRRRRSEDRFGDLYRCSHIPSMAANALSRTAAAHGPQASHKKWLKGQNGSSRRSSHEEKDSDAHRRSRERKPANRHVERPVVDEGNSESERRRRSDSPFAPWSPFNCVVLDEHSSAGAGKKNKGFQSSSSSSTARRRSLSLSSAPSLRAIVSANASLELSDRKALLSNNLPQRKNGSNSHDASPLCRNEDSAILARSASSPLDRGSTSSLSASSAMLLAPQQHPNAQAPEVAVDATRVEEVASGVAEAPPPTEPLVPCMQHGERRVRREQQQRLEAPKPAFGCETDRDERMTNTAKTSNTEVQLACGKGISWVREKHDSAAAVDEPLPCSLTVPTTAGHVRGLSTSVAVVDSAVAALVVTHRRQSGSGLSMLAKLAEEEEKQEPRTVPTRPLSRGSSWHSPHPEALTPKLGHSKHHGSLHTMTSLTSASTPTTASCDEKVVVVSKAVQTCS